MSNPEEQDGTPNTEADAEALGNDELDEISGGAVRKPTKKGPGLVASDPDNGDNFWGSDFNEAKGATWP